MNSTGNTLSLATGRGEVSSSVRQEYAEMWILRTPDEKAARLGADPIFWKYKVEVILHQRWVLTLSQLMDPPSNTIPKPPPTSFPSFPSPSSVPASTKSWGHWYTSALHPMYRTPSLAGAQSTAPARSHLHALLLLHYQYRMRMFLPDIRFWGSLLTPPLLQHHPKTSLLFMLLGHNFPLQHVYIVSSIFPQTLSVPWAWGHFLSCPSVSHIPRVTCGTY